MRFSIGDRKIKLTGTLDDPDGNAIALTGYNRLYVRIFRPDGTSFTKDALPTDANNLTNGKITYTTTDADFLDQDGIWHWTVAAEWDDARTESASRGVFKVM